MTINTPKLSEFLESGAYRPRGSDLAAAGVAERLSLNMFVELILASASRYWLRMDKSAKCRSCGGKVALGRCLGCGAYPRSRRWWIIPALAILALAALDALMGDGQQHISTLTSLFGPVQ